MAALGAWIRWGVSEKLALAGWWPWGTLAVNVFGSLLAGGLYVISYEMQLLPAGWREGLLIGFCGALTTYSSWSLELVRLLEEEAWSRAILVFFLNNLLCLGGCALAMWVTRQIFEKSHF
jgi:CrcB protein